MFWVIRVLTALSPSENRLMMLILIRVLLVVPYYKNKVHRLPGRLPELALVNSQSYLAFRLFEPSFFFAGIFFQISSLSLTLYPWKGKSCVVWGKPGILLLNITQYSKGEYPLSYEDMIDMAYLLWKPIDRNITHIFMDKYLYIKKPGLSLTYYLSGVLPEIILRIKGRRKEFLDNI